MLPLAQGQASQKQLKWAFALRAAQSLLCFLISAPSSSRRSMIFVCLILVVRKQ